MQFLREQLMRHEGMRLFPYTDTVGKLTIGVGRNLTDRGLSKDEVMYLLNNDLALVVEEVQRYIPWSRQLDDARRDVLYNMCFNMGIRKLLGFKNFLSCLRVGAYADAADHMLNSLWAKQVGERAEELAFIVRGE